jgi:hypothetical protein
MKVENTLKVYEFDEKEIVGDEPHIMKVISHWLYNDRVILEYGDFKITVLVRDIHKAVDNASNFK